MLQARGGYLFSVVLSLFSECSLSLSLYNPLSCTVLNNINFLFVIQFKRVFPFVQDNNLFDLSLSFPCQKNHLQKPITIYYYFFGSALYPVIWSRCFLERQIVLLFVWFFSLVYQTEGRSPFSGFQLSRLVSFITHSSWCMKTMSASQQIIGY